MTTYYDRQIRLEPSSDEWNFQESFEARLNDPVWFLARQWQMGEHQGENATSPVLVTFNRTSIPMQPLANNPAFDPTVVPAEALVESELEDWWTMGRRVRIGHRVAQQVGLGETETHARFHSLPPPYDAFEGEFDGKALWDLRQTLGIAETVFGADAPPPDAPWAWNSARLEYEESFPVGTQKLNVSAHHGGAMDWYSADGEGEPDTASAHIDSVTAMPTPLEYPGAPNSRFWQIEDARTDIGGYPPDLAHFPTMLLVDLIYSHSDDWFLFPIVGHAGHIIGVSQLVVQDSFGETYNESDFRGLKPPEDWTLWACKGLKANQLVLWSVAELPLESIPLESVQFGIDEQMNWLWAVERVLDTREADAQDSSAPDDAARPPFQPNPPSGDMTKPRTFQYIPAKELAARWHPYLIEEINGERRFVQYGLADLSRQRPVPMPHPRAETLFGGTPPQRELHWLYPSAIPSNGIQVERRWMLARDRGGHPVLWIQRQRKPLYAPPARNLRYDVLEESGKE